MCAVSQQPFSTFTEGVRKRKPLSMSAAQQDLVRCSVRFQKGFQKKKLFAGFLPSFSFMHLLLSCISSVYY